MAESHHIAEVVGGIVAILLLAMVLLAATRRIRLPFTISLVLVGIALAALCKSYPEAFPALHELHLSPGLILYVFLPALVFESAFNLDVRLLRRNLLPVLVLAVPGLLLSTALIGVLVSWATPIPLPAALLLGSILSATDPVAVVAIFKKLGAPQRLTVLVEGESLFNDASAIVISRIILGIVMGGAFTFETVSDGAVEFVTVFVGGLVVGWLLALLTGWFLGRMESEPNVEITLTAVLAYGSFLVAEEGLHVSGVMATIAAALTFGGWGKMKISQAGRHQLEHFWEYGGFLANTLVFLMVGLRVDLSELVNSWQALVWVILAMQLSRAVVIYGMVPLAKKLPGFEPVNRRFQTVMFWGGLRGAIALALVMSLPEFPERELFLTLTIGAVLFTLLAQGLSIETLVNRLKLNVPPLADQFSRLEGDLAARQKALERLPELLSGGLFSYAISDQLRCQCEGELRHFKDEISSLRKRELDSAGEVDLLRLRCLAEENSLYLDLFNHGQLSEAAFWRLVADLNEQMDSIRYEGGGQWQLSFGWFERIRERWLGTAARTAGLRRLVDPLRRRLIAQDYELVWARYQGAIRIMALLDELQKLESLEASVASPLRSHYESRASEYRRRIDLTAEQFPEFVTHLQKRLARRLVLMAESSVIHDRAEHGVMPRSIASEIEHHIEQELRRMRGQTVPRSEIKPEELLRRVPLFQTIPENQFPVVAKRLEPLAVREDEDVVKQGERGNSLYLIARGVVRVCREENGETHELATLMAGDFFGELALLRDEKRSATVHAVTPCSLYELSRKALNELLAENADLKNALEQAGRVRQAELAALGVSPAELLSKAPFFEVLSESEFKVIAESLIELKLPERETVFRQGDQGDSVYFIARGVVRVSEESGGKVRQLAVLSEGDFFGEGGLLHASERGATVQTVSPCTLYQLKRDMLMKFVNENPDMLDVLEQTDQFRRDDTQFHSRE